VLRFSPAVASVLSTGPMAARISISAALRALGPGRFDVAVTPVRSLRAAWLLRRSGAPVRVGFGGGPERVLLTHAAPVRPFEVVFSRRFERLAAVLGVPTGAPARLVVDAPRREAAAPPPNAPARSAGPPARAGGGGVATRARACRPLPGLGAPAPAAGPPGAPRGGQGGAGPPRGARRPSARHDRGPDGGERRRHPCRALSRRRRSGSRL